MNGKFGIELQFLRRNVRKNEGYLERRIRRMYTLSQKLPCKQKCGRKGILSGNRPDHGSQGSIVRMWEEPCNIAEPCSFPAAVCDVYFQNTPIASGQIGKPISIERLSEIFLELQKQNAANINLVTPTHSLQIVAALDLAKEQTIPVVYNCSGYETVETLRKMEKYVDIYLPDFKYMSPVLSAKYSHAPDYCEVAKNASGRNGSPDRGMSV